jgi:hypothetical protein
VNLIYNPGRKERVVGINGLCTIPTRAILHTAIFLTPETGNRVDLAILKFGTRLAGFQVSSRNLRRNRSDVSGDHRESPPKVSQIIDKVLRNGKFGLPERHPRRSRIPPWRQDVIGGVMRQTL